MRTAAHPSFTRHLTWLDPETKKTTPVECLEAISERLSLSPNGETEVIEKRAELTFVGSQGDLHQINLSTLTESQFTYAFDHNREPNWTASGKIYWAAGPPGDSDVYLKNADDTGPEELIVEGADFPKNSPDEQWPVFRKTKAEKACRLLVLKAVQRQRSIPQQ